MTLADTIAQQLAAQNFDAALDGLAELRRLRQAELDEVEAEIATLSKGEEFGLPGHMRQALIRYREARPRAKQRVKDIELQIDQVREGRAAAGRSHGGALTEAQHRQREKAAAYVEALEAIEHAAAALAAALRRGRALGAEAYELIDDGRHVRRLFSLGSFRERVMAGLFQFFEDDPNGAGAWNGERALLRFDTKGSIEIARRGIARYEIKVLRDNLGPDVGATL